MGAIICNGKVINMDRVRLVYVGDGVIVFHFDHDSTTVYFDKSKTYILNAIYDAIAKAMCYKHKVINLDNILPKCNKD